MPGESGDLISSALQVSLQKDKSETELNSLLSFSVKQVLLTEIKYELYQQDSAAFLDELKSKYTVISEKDSAESVVNNVKVVPNHLGKSPSKVVVYRSHGSEHAGVEKPDPNKPKLPSPEHVLWSPDKISVGWRNLTPIGSGFVNLGKTCYINSTLQALFHITPFVNWLLMEKNHSCPSNSWTSECLICSVAQTLKSSQESTGKAIKPFLIYNKFESICKHLDLHEQEDAHEFLRHLVSSLDRTYLLSFKSLKLDHLSKETTPLSQIFGGYLRNEVVCQMCGNVSTTFQHFQDLPLDIRNVSNLEAALCSFFSKECLSEQEGYVCEKCKQKVPFTKRFFLEKAPRVLCIQLKRFGAMSGKNNKSVGIPVRLSLTRFRAEGRTELAGPYHLVATVNHLGTSTNCGHYTAVALASDHKYYLFDDSRVERLNSVEMYSSHAYIVLYEQKPATPSVPNGIKPEVRASCTVNHLVNSQNKLNFNSGECSVYKKEKEVSPLRLSNGGSAGPSPPPKTNEDRSNGQARPLSADLIKRKEVRPDSRDRPKQQEPRPDSRDRPNQSEPRPDCRDRPKQPDPRPDSRDRPNQPEQRPDSRDRPKQPEPQPDSRERPNHSEQRPDSRDRPKQPEARPDSRERPNQSEQRPDSRDRPKQQESRPDFRDRPNQPESSHRPSQPGPPLLNGNNHNLSLVPYNESSSSSESGGNSPGRHEWRTNGTVPTATGPTTTGHTTTGHTTTGHTTPTRLTHTPSTTPTPSPSPITNGHHNGSSPSTGSGMNGKGRNGGWHVYSAESTPPPPNPPSNPNKRPWKVSSLHLERGDFKNEYINMSHRGYGKHVSTWCGDKSEMEKEVNRENMNQRVSLSMEDKYDSPMKKMKKYHGNRGMNPGKNRFQEFQKRKNGWTYKGGGGRGSHRNEPYYRGGPLHHPRWSHNV